MGYDSEDHEADWAAALAEAHAELEKEAWALIKQGKYREAAAVFEKMRVGLLDGERDKA